MIARTYVGYGTSTLGLPSIGGQVGDADTPSTWILPNSLTGTPGSYLQGSMTSWVMMNHFVLSNWYDPTNGSHCQEIQISGTASTVAGSNKVTDVTYRRRSSQPVGPPFSREVVGINTGRRWCYSWIFDSHLQQRHLIRVQDPRHQQRSTNTSNGTDFVLTGKVDKITTGSIYDSNRNVKILKYYSGATLEGTVSLDGIGPVPNARILIGNAFSGEEIRVNGHVVDRDLKHTGFPLVALKRTKMGSFHSRYQRKDTGIRVLGRTRLESARTSLMTGSVSSMQELFVENSQNKNVNAITGILGNVYGSTWLSETIVNVSEQMDTVTAKR